MRIIALSGCPAALPALKYLFSKQYLTAMICPEETAGFDTSNLESWARYHELPCWQVSNQHLEREINELSTEIKPDLIIVYGFPYNINGQWLQKVKHGGWNIHFSLHPEKEASVTIHQLSDGVAYGQVISYCKLALLPSNSSSIDQLSQISVGLLQEAFERLKAKN